MNVNCLIALFHSLGTRTYKYYLNWGEERQKKQHMVLYIKTSITLKSNFYFSERNVLFQI